MFALHAGLPDAVFSRIFQSEYGNDMISCIVALQVAAALFFVAAAFNDLATRSIPNGISLFLLVDGAALRLLHGDFAAVCGAALLVFLLALFCWFRGWLGGGDVKLLAAGMLAFPLADSADFIFLTALMGGGLALIYLFLHRVVKAPQGARANKSVLARVARAERWRIARRGPLPYAVAIASAGLFLLLRR